MTIKSDIVLWRWTYETREDLEEEMERLDSKDSYFLEGMGLGGRRFAQLVFAMFRYILKRLDVVADRTPPSAAGQPVVEE